MPSATAAATAGKRIKIGLRSGRIELGTPTDGEPVPVDLPQSWLTEFDSAAFFAHTVLSSPLWDVVSPTIRLAEEQLVRVELAKVALAYTRCHGNLIAYRAKYERMLVQLRRRMAETTTTAAEKVQIFDLVRRMMLELQTTQPTIDRLQALRDGRAILAVSDRQFYVVQADQVSLPENVPTADYSELGVIPAIVAVIVVGICVALFAVAAWGTASAIMEPRRLNEDAKNKLISAQTEALRLMSSNADAADARGDHATAAAIRQQAMQSFRDDIAAIAAGEATVATAEKEPGITTVALYLGGGYLLIRALESHR